MHVIRLRGPWEYEPLARAMRLETGDWQLQTADLPPGGRASVPADWGATLGPEFRGRVRYMRRFGQPTGLSPSAQIWLAVDGVDAFASVSLNGESLGEVVGPEFQAQFNVTEYLKPRNILILDIEKPKLGAPGGHGSVSDSRPGSPGGLIGEVRLEIE
jgi:hypothetical protein